MNFFSTMFPLVGASLKFLKMKQFFGYFYLLNVVPNELFLIKITPQIENFMRFCISDLSFFRRFDFIH